MPADGPFIAKLKQLVQEADYCGKTINREEVLKKLHEFRDLYVDSSFSMDVAIAAKAAVLVFRGASNAVAGYRRADQFPVSSSHVRAELKLNKGTSIVEIIKDATQAAIDEDAEGPNDQCVVSIPGYYSKIRMSSSEAHVFPHEIWLQVGCRETPMHVDHGRTVAYLPPCQQKAFKIWVFFRAMKDARSIRVGKTENSMNRVLGASCSSTIWSFTLLLSPMKPRRWTKRSGSQSQVMS